MEIINGTKYEILDDEEIKFYRVAETLQGTTDNKYKLVNVDNEKDSITVDNEYLNAHSICIAPDAYVNMMIVELNGEDIKNLDYDVYICVNKAADILKDKAEPSLVLRQNVYSETKNLMAAGNKIYMGECYTVFNKDNITEVMDIRGIASQFSVAFYIGDSQDDILKFTRAKFKKDVKTTLNELKTKMNAISGGMADGILDSLAGLMTDNGFIENLYGLFNIGSLPFPIDLGKVSYNSEGDLILNSKQHKALEDYLKRYISNVTVLEYDRDIDIANIVSLTHIMVRDTNGKIYLIAFKTDGYYPEGNEDILRAMKM